MIFATVGLAGVFFCVARFVQNRGPFDVAAGCTLFLLLVVAMVLALRWKLCVDEHGITRRSLFGRDSWTWNDLASGRIDKLYPYTLRAPARPWWRRKLRLGYMSSDDIQEVLGEINRHYRLPPPPEIPDTLKIKYGIGRSAVFDDKGVHLVVRGAPLTYLWAEVQGVHVTRMDPVRRDFMSLVITLPDQEIELKLVTHQGGTSPTWRGATSEVVNEFLLRHVPPARVDVSVVGEPLQKREHVERRLRKAESSLRFITIVMAVFVPLLVALLVWMAIADGVVKAIVMAGMVALSLGPLFAFVYRSHRKQVGQLRDRLKSLPDTPSTKEDHP